MPEIFNIPTLQDYLKNYRSRDEVCLNDFFGKNSDIESYSGQTLVSEISGVKTYTNSFWTAKQRQASSIHEISYRACFKPQLPRFFIEMLTDEGDIVYDPFTGRGTTVIEAALLKRNIISNDINPLSKILCKPRLNPPLYDEIKNRLEIIEKEREELSSFSLSMFYHPKTESEIVSLKNYLEKKRANGKEDNTDQWIRMTATNRLTGHSPGFFSVYTLPPNQAVSKESQIKINEKKGQSPEYRDTTALILKKSRQLLKDITAAKINTLKSAGEKAIFLTEDAAKTKSIPSDSVSLTVTSPPFLNIVQYASDNWLRCWFNSLDAKEIGKNITMEGTTSGWCSAMEKVFYELFRITKPFGWVAFEVGEVKNKSVFLDEYVIPLGKSAGFECAAVLINEQNFTKTSNIWGISNKKRGTNTNRVVIFQKKS
ncbi:MAG: DNA methyltransferase [Methanomicrobium sp.]|nr:DNA methyltransferase [Methanomicrobium sp.]